jgi:hypothetical protein
MWMLVIVKDWPGCKCWIGLRVTPSVLVGVIVYGAVAVMVGGVVDLKVGTAEAVIVIVYAAGSATPGVRASVAVEVANWPEPDRAQAATMSAVKDDERKRIRIFLKPIGLSVGFPT